MFLCSLVLQYESMSKRFVPEAINFLAQSLVLLFPLMEEPEKLPGDFPMADYGRGELHGLLLGRKDSPPATRPTLLQALSAPDNSKDVKAYLAETAIACLSEFASMYNTLPAFIELVQPVSDILGLIDASRVAKPLQVGSHPCKLLCVLTEMYRRPGLQHSKTACHACSSSPGKQESR